MPKTPSAEIRKNDASLRVLFQLSADMLGVLDGSGKLSTVNPSWERVVGWDEKNLTSRPFLSLIHPQDAENLDSGLKRLQDGQAFVTDIRLLCKDNSFQRVSCHFVKDAEKQWVVITGRDFSLHMENEIVLKKARLAAEQVDKAKSEFLANISHEFRTPLNAVIGFSELLNSSVEGEKNRDYISSITSSAKGLLTLLNSILDLSKIEAGMMAIQSAPTDLKRLIADVGQVFQKELEEKNLYFKVNYECESDKSFVLDECRVRQVMINIVGNAVKFTEEGGITISVKTAKLKASPQCTDLSISVEDTGIGIPKQEQKAVFESFVQQSGQSNRKYGGTGLGLSISNKLVRLMNGELKLKSIQGKGSIFTVVLKSVKIEEGFAGSNVEWALAQTASKEQKNCGQCVPANAQCEEYIRTEILPLAEYLGKSVKVSQVNQLANILAEKEEQHGSPRLRAYGEVLRGAADKFDIPMLNAVIGSMRRYLEDLLPQR